MYYTYSMDPPEEEDSVFECEECHSGLYVGDDYYEIDGTIMCEDCAIEWLKSNFRKTIDDSYIGPDPDEEYDKYVDDQISAHWFDD